MKLVNRMIGINNNPERNPKNWNEYVIFISPINSNVTFPFGSAPLGTASAFSIIKINLFSFSVVSKTCSSVESEFRLSLEFRVSDTSSSQQSIYSS